MAEKSQTMIFKKNENSHSSQDVNNMKVVIHCHSLTSEFHYSKIIKTALCIIIKKEAQVALKARSDNNVLCNRP